jgi:hypothetical protein
MCWLTDVVVFHEQRNLLKSCQILLRLERRLEVEYLRSKMRTTYAPSLGQSQAIQEFLVAATIGPIKGELVRRERQQRGFSIKLSAHQQDR